MRKTVGFSSLVTAFLLILCSGLFAQTADQQKKEEEFQMSDYSGWAMLRTENLVHPNDKNLTATAKMLKKSESYNCLFLITITHKTTDKEGKEQNEVREKGYYLGFSSLESKNYLLLSNIHRHVDDGKWYLSEEISLELKIGPEDFAKVADAAFDDLVDGMKNPPRQNQQ